MTPLMEKEQELGFCSKIFQYLSPEDLPLFNICAHQIFVNYKKISKKPRKVNNLTKGVDPSNKYMLSNDDNTVWYPHSASRTAVKHLGPNTLMSKRDKGKAYKSVLKHIQNYCTDAESVPGGVVINTRSVFGAIRAFDMWDESLGSPLEFVYMLAVCKFLLEEGIDPVLNYLLQRWVDDYILFLAADENFQPRWEVANKITLLLDNLDTRLEISMVTENFSLSLVSLGHAIDSTSMASSTSPMTEGSTPFLLLLHG
jgi:hypothetical protein